MMPFSALSKAKKHKQSGSIAFGPNFVSTSTWIAVDKTENMEKYFASSMQKKVRTFSGNIHKQKWIIAGLVWPIAVMQSHDRGNLPNGGNSSQCIILGFFSKIKICGNKQIKCLCCRKKREMLTKMWFLCVKL